LELPVMLTPRTILVMDDDQDVLGLLQSFLESHGYQVRLASDGEDGLALAREAQPDLVVLDMLMPRLSGFGVLERLKADGEAAPPVIMMTAHGGRQHQSYAQFLGVDDYLTKPFPLARLLEAVQRLCPLPQPEATPAAVD
jgi:DNA-binding response OmpR family regulator